jgi:sulfonate transport system permease protein
MGKVYGLKGFALFRDIIFPGALSSILVGVRLSLGTMWLILIAAETIAADAGIGYMAMTARELMQMDKVVLSIIIYALLGKLSDVIASWLERRLLQWRVVS